MKKNILIIGSSGYLGKKLKRSLKKKFNLTTPSSKVLNIHKISDVNKYSKKKFDFIINLSGQLSSNINKMKKTIVEGNRNLIRLNKGKKTIIYFISSSLVYGFSKKQKKEISSKNPVGNYAKFKSIAEEEYLKSKIKFKILRLCNVYNGKKKGLINNIVRSLRDHKKLILTNPKVYRNYIHVDDFLNIMNKMLKKKLREDIYNIGYQNLNLIQIIKYVEKKLRYKIHFIDKDIALNKIPSQKICSDRILREIKYKPKINIKKYLINKCNNES